MWTLSQKPWTKLHKVKEHTRLFYYFEHRLHTGLGSKVKSGHTRYKCDIRNQTF